VEVQEEEFEVYGKGIIGYGEVRNTGGLGKVR
jgi:hypothetical protein